jgi:hypothetical protein
MHLKFFLQALQNLKNAHLMLKNEKGLESLLARERLEEESKRRS